MSSNINNLINGTISGKISQDLDALDGVKDGKIKASVWNAFVDKIGTGKKIKSEITVENALKSITTYSIRQASGAGKSATELAKEWRNDLGVIINNEVNPTAIPEPIEPIPSIQPVQPTQITNEKSFDETYNGKSVGESLYNEVNGAGSGHAKNILTNDVTPQNVKELIETFNDMAQSSGKKITEFLNNEWALSKEKCAIPAQKLLDYPFEPVIKTSAQYTALQDALNDYVQNGGDDKAAAVDNAIETFIDYVVNNTDIIADPFHNEYAADGQPTKITVYDGSGAIDHVVNYEYNADGKETKRSSHNEDGTVNWETRIEYDTNGNEIKRTSYKGDGTADWETHFEYDADGREIKRTKYNGDGSASWEAHRAYDANGNLTQKTSYNADGSVKFVEFYEYDADNNLTKTTRYDANGNEIPQ